MGARRATATSPRAPVPLAPSDPARPVAGGWHLASGVGVRCSGEADGDMAGAGPAVASRRRRVVDLPWTVLRQVHGARVVVVDRPGARSGEEADAAVSAAPGAALAVLTADCAPVALSSAEGVFGVAHAGWRGLAAGVVEATVEAMRELGATEVAAVLGPCIRPCCYPFGDEDLDALSRRLGPAVRAEDRDGHPALDVPAAVSAALAAAGAALLGEDPRCTGCGGGLWSWRVGRAAQRQATVAWRR